MDKLIAALEHSYARLETICRRYCILGSNLPSHEEHSFLDSLSQELLKSPSWTKSFMKSDAANVHCVSTRIFSYRWEKPTTIVLR
jgi:hypothetical protein